MSAKPLSVEQIMELPQQQRTIIQAVHQVGQELPGYFAERVVLVALESGTILARLGSEAVLARLAAAGVAFGFVVDDLAHGPAERPSAPIELLDDLVVSGRRLPHFPSVCLFVGQRRADALDPTGWDEVAEILLYHLESKAIWYQGEFERQTFETRRTKLEAFHLLTSEFSQIGELDALLPVVVERITELMDAGSTVIYEASATGPQLVPLVGYKMEPEQLKETRYEIDLGSNFVSQVYTNGKFLIVDDVDHPDGWEPVPALSALGFASALVMPIRLVDRPVGVMIIGRYAYQPFDTSQAEVLAFTAHQIALTHENIRLRSELQSRLEEMNEELLLAQGMQKAMLPREPLSVGDLEVAGFSNPAKHLGGDYFDYFARDRFLNVVVADIVGKGVSAALLMSILRSHIYTVFLDDARLTLENINRLSSLVYRDFRPHRAFATVLLMNIDLDARKLVVFSAGNSLPIFVRNGELQSFPGKASPAMGLFDNRPLGAFIYEVPLEVGDVLVGFTDGPTDTIVENGRLGLAGLREFALANVAKYQSATEILAGLRSDVQRVTVVQADDTTLCVLKA